MDRGRKFWGALALSGGLMLVGCGGGGGGGGSNLNNPPSSGSNPPPASSTDFEEGIFSNPSTYAAQCAVPRGAGFNDSQGSAEDENDWLRAWSHELYLWYDEITDRDPRDYSTPDYFELMKTEGTTPSGSPKDQFHFTYDTEVWQQLSQSGISAGYGVSVELISASPPRRAVVAFVEPGSPAEAAGLTRGTAIIEVDGADLVNGGTQADVDVLNAGLFPDAAGESHDFVVEDFDGANRRSITMVSAEITQDPVPTARIIETVRGPVGYMLFNDHIAPAEAALVEEIESFAAAGIVDLVLDLRYNGGGYLDIANELAFMIAGPSAASGRVFGEIQFNDKHTSINPITGAGLSPEFFHETTQGFSLTSGDSLPSLSIPRVYVLSTGGTCSASESIINGLRGIGFEVVLVGGATCGKPYGFYPEDNCGTTYFSIQFRGLNAAGFGDYADGFVPTETPLEEYEVFGCDASDDFSRALGDVDETLLATALHHMENGDCVLPIAVSSAAEELQVADSATSGGLPIRQPVRIPGMIIR